MIRSSRGAAASTALLLAVAVAGCSSSAHKAGSSGSAPAGTASSPSGAVPSAGADPADRATKQVITAAYVKFFDPATSLAQSEAVLEHGSSFTQILADEAKSSAAQKASATVSAVTVSGNLATVTYSILGAGKPLLPDQKGYAVREQGTWKVAAATFCQLLQYEGKQPAPCKDPAITALPH